MQIAAVALPFSTVCLQPQGSSLTAQKPETVLPSCANPPSDLAKQSPAQSSPSVQAFPASAKVTTQEACCIRQTGRHSPPLAIQLA
jgi:hypothetical protein